MFQDVYLVETRRKMVLRKILQKKMKSPLTSNSSQRISSSNAGVQISEGELKPIGLVLANQREKRQTSEKQRSHVTPNIRFIINFLWPFFLHAAYLQVPSGQVIYLFQNKKYNLSFTKIGHEEHWTSSSSIVRTFNINLSGKNFHFKYYMNYYIKFIFEVLSDILIFNINYCQ